MITKKLFFKYLISVCLALAMLLTPTLSVFAGKQQTKYVKDIMFIYGKDLEDAQKKVPTGYTMLETDLNQGAAYVFAVDDVYLAYSTTTDPDEAITDIRMMNMKGGFVMSDYEEQINNVSNKIRDLANCFKDAVGEFKEKYIEGLSGAKSAYVALNYFTVDEADGRGLADYLLYDNVPDSFYLKLMLNAHIDILSTIFSALAMAVQGDVGDTWLDRLAEFDDPSDFYKDEYWDKATALWPLFNNFYEIYSSIDHDVFRDVGGEIKENDPEENADGENSDENETVEGSNVENTGNELLYELAYAALDSYKFGNGDSVAEWLVNAELYEEMLYPLIHVLTPGEYAMMCLSGPMYMTLATGMNESVYQDYTSQISELIDETGKCSIWHGVNAELFRSSIGITDEANRAIAETNAEKDLTNDGDSANDTLLKTASLVAAIGAISLGTGIVITTFSAGSLVAMLSGTASTLGVLSAISGSLAIIVGIVVICVALVMAVIHVVAWLKAWYDEHHPDYTEIPEYMYDLVTDDEENSKFVLYEAAKASDGKAADVNAWEGKEWHAVYCSRDRAAGKPIEADFKIKLGDGRVDENYSGVCTFGQIVSENFNHYADNDDVKGIYVSYRQQSQSGAYAKGQYLSDVKLFSDKKMEVCHLKLKAEGYTLYNLNLTPDSNKYTYIGYKTTNRTNRALTDIRLCYDYSATQYNTGSGSATYAASGSAGKLTLYTTRVSLFGSPILSDFVVTDNRHSVAPGYEPVNFFSGGPAVDLNMSESAQKKVTNHFYFYFLPSVTYTDGPEYLGGLSTFVDMPAYHSFVDDGNVVSHARKNGYEVLGYVAGKSGNEAAIVYTTTHNPYRAIYGVTAMSNGGYLGDLFPQSIRFKGVTYSVAPRFLVHYSDNSVIDRDSRDDDSKIYVSPIYVGGEPMTVDELCASQNVDFRKNDFYPVISILAETGNAANLSNAFNYTYKTTVQDDEKITVEVEIPPIYLFVKDEDRKVGSYITGIFLTSKEQILDGLDIKCKNLDNSYITMNLASQGADVIIRKNINIKDSDNATYLSYAKDPDSRNPITDIIAYYEGNTKREPQRKIVKDGIVYHLASDVNLFCKENEVNSKCKRVYIYYTTNPSAGAPITDICIDNDHIKDGWETVLSQRDKALYNEMDEYKDEMWFIHIKREIPTQMYISEIVVGYGSESKAKGMLLEAGCTYIVDKDLNELVGFFSDYVYIGYKKTSDPTDAIRDIKTKHTKGSAKIENAFELNGIMYVKIDGNLNSGTYSWSDDIYLYYTKDEKAGTPIITIEAYNKVVNGTIGGTILSTVENTKSKASDVNEGALGEYVYLVIGRSSSDAPLQASMIGEGSFMVILGLVVCSLSCAAIVAFYLKRSAKTSVSRGNDNKE